MTTLLPIAFGLLLQSTLLILLGLAAMRLARRHGPAIQSLLGRATLAGLALALLLAGPLAGHVKPVWRITAGGPTPRQVAAPPGTGGAGGKVGGASYLLDEASLSHASSGQAPSGRTPLGHVLPDRPFGHAPLTDPLPIIPPNLSTTFSAPPPVPGGAATCRGVGSLWASGTALLLLWLALCQSHLTRLRRSASPVVTGPAAEALAALTPRPPLLRAHPSVRSPFLAGVRHPAIFLPTAHESEFDPAALRAILAHELAHLARRDNLWTLAARLLTALLWPQPLLWVLCRRLEQAGEEASDLAVLAQDCPPRAYADCLLTLAERHPLGRRERALGVGVAPYRSSLGRRIGRILDKGTHSMSAVTLRLRLTVAALAVAAALGGVFLVSSAPAQSPGRTGNTATLTSEQLTKYLATLTPEQRQFRATKMQDMSNLKQIGIALSQYAQDHDGHFPNAAHWMEALSPYLKDKTVFFDPFQPGAKRYGYAFNRNCSGRSLAFFDYPSAEVMAFDSTLGTRDASDTGQSVRYTAHSGGRYSSILFVDAHVKWMRASELPSFAIQHSPRPGYRPRRVGQSQAPTAFTQAHFQQFRALTAALTASDSNPELSNARFLAGLTPVQGPGVVVTLRDSKKSFPAMPNGVAPPSIIHDTDINQVVNELKAAGAEAIAVNDQRLIATSSVRTAGATVLINFVPTAPPYVIRAIGDPKTLASAMSLPGGVASQLKAFDPAMFSVQGSGMLTLPAYSGGSQPRYAKPVSAAIARQQALDADLSRAQASALAQQHEQLQAQLRAMDAEAAAVSTYLRGMHARVTYAAKGQPSLDAYSLALMAVERQALAARLAAAQADLSQKAATLPPASPAVITAKRKVQALEQTYREQPIRGKQAFVKAVHQYNQRRAAALALASAEDAAARQLRSIQARQHQLQAAIAFLDAQIAQHKTPASSN